MRPGRDRSGDGDRLPKRLIATDHEKRRLTKAGRKLGAQLKELTSFVTYQTFARWVREVEKNHQTKAVPPKRKVLHATGILRTSPDNGH